MVDIFASFLLKFGHITTFILPVIILFIIFYKKEICLEALSFLFCIMIWNTLLKQLFKVPLFPHLGEGYAFPSGHMHATAVFYGYFFCSIKNKTVKNILLFLIFGIGFSLFHCNFHNWLDIIGALFFAIIELSLVFFIKQKWGNKILAWATICFSITNLLILNHIYSLKFHLWLAFYGLLGCLSGLTLFPKTKLKNCMQKIIALVLSVLFVVTIEFLFKTFHFKNHAITQTKLFLLPISITYAIYLAKKISTNRYFTSNNAN